MLPPSLGSTRDPSDHPRSPACSRRLGLSRATGAPVPRFRERASGYASMSGGPRAATSGPHAEESPMKDDPDDLRHDDPEGGHDPDALEEGARRMRATKAGDKTERDPD